MSNSAGEPLLRPHAAALLRALAGAVRVERSGTVRRAYAAAAAQVRSVRRGGRGASRLQGRQRGYALLSAARRLLTSGWWAVRRLRAMRHRPKSPIGG
jgi:hypothetical protein